MFVFDTSYYNSIKVFIASPSDTHEERQITENVIKETDRICRATLGLRVECLKWEDLPPLTPNPEEGHMQDVINRELLNKCNVFVLILNKRYGSVASGQTVSNTEREIEAILNIIEKQRNVTLLTYFHHLSENEDQGDQESKVRELRKRLEKKELVYHQYKTLEDFQQKFTHHLYYVSIRFQSAVTKQRSLRAFWDMGSREGQNPPRLSIIYPPLDRNTMKTQNPDTIWLERLVPNVVFEDFKAINKIEKVLRLIGHHQIYTHTSAGLSHEVYDMNRIWLCVPRNRPALRQVLTYQEEAWFKFQPRQTNSEGSILWRPPNSQDFVEIKSPLSRYLYAQRFSNPGGEWNSLHSRVVAKDYAILARFVDKREQGLKDYFLAGIRGLGTWGAGWFIDRRYKAFLQWEDQPRASIQMLLEVTYKNEHIDEVKDVSNKPISYFENEYNMETITNTIRELQDD